MTETEFNALSPGSVVWIAKPQLVVPIGSPVSRVVIQSRCGCFEDRVLWLTKDGVRLQQPSETHFSEAEAWAFTADAFDAGIVHLAKEIHAQTRQLQALATAASSARTLARRQSA